MLATFNHRNDRTDSLNSRNGRGGLDSGKRLSGLGDLYEETAVSRKSKRSPDNAKKMPKSREPKLCLVCGDLASGCHYSVLSCEGCKGFFRRSIVKKQVHQCKYENTCDIDMYMRRKCQQCRLKKCLQVGMRSEGKVSTTVSVVAKLARGKETAKPIRADNEGLIDRLIHFQSEFDQPSEDDMKKISVNKPSHSFSSFKNNTTAPTKTPGIHDSDAQVQFKHMTEMTILTVKLTVDFSKRLPGFDSLLRQDQITLLKACSSEVMMLRCARRYDAKTDSILFANNLSYSRETYRIAGLGDTVDSIFRFGKTLCQMKIDNAEYALLTAIDIFSERSGLVEALKVEKIQEIYVDALQDYVVNQRVPRPMNELAKLLRVLTELRTLSNLNSQMCYSLKLKNKRLPPFLVEIWDV